MVFNHGPRKWFQPGCHGRQRQAQDYDLNQSLSYFFMEIPGTETVKCETNVLAVCGRRWQTVLSVSF